MSFQYFEDLFHTTLRMQPNPTEETKINQFHTHLKGLVFKPFKNIERTPPTTLEDILEDFRRKHVKPESSASTKHRFKRLSFELEDENLDELQESADKAIDHKSHGFLLSGFNRRAVKVLSRVLIFVTFCDICCISNSTNTCCTSNIILLKDWVSEG